MADRESVDRMIEKPRHFRNFILALLAGFVVLITISELTNGLFPFLEVAIAGAVVYFIARR